MPPVAGLLGVGKVRRPDRRQPEVAPPAKASGQRCHLPVPELLQRHAGEQRAATGLAVHHHRTIPRHELLDLELDLPARHEDRPGQVPLGRLVGLPDVEQGGRMGTGKLGGEHLGRDLAHCATRLEHHLAKAGHGLAPDITEPARRAEDGGRRRRQGWSSTDAWRW